MIYTIRDGDTFERVSTIVYGSPTKASALSEANPQTSGGLATGMALNVPEELITGGFQQRVSAARDNEVSINLGGARFRFWSTMRLRRSMDQFDTFSLGAPFEPDNAEFRASFVPLAFTRAQIFVGGEQLYTGTNINTPPHVGLDGRTVSSDGYALAGVLNDCTMPGTSFPLEYDSLDLRQIALAMGVPFGLVPSFTADPGPAFERVAITHTTKVLSFWKKLAQQRDLIISNDVFGQPVFQQEATGVAVQILTEGAPPVLEVDVDFQPQQYYSHVTAITPAETGIDGSQYTATNPFLTGVLRPLVFDAPDTFGADAQQTAQAKLGRMFANALSYRVRLAGWRTAAGSLWAPNTLVKLLAPGAMVYSEIDFLIRAVELERNASEDIATLELVLPGSFSGRAPRSLPWLG